jgi:hypothetical protein
MLVSKIVDAAAERTVPPPATWLMAEWLMAQHFG